MAGPLALALVPVEQHTEKTTVSAIGEHWEVQYARFFNHPHPPLSSNHPSLAPLPAGRRNRRKGNWISSASSSTASLTPTADHTGFLLAVTFLGKIYEEHYIGKLHFSWPHMSCVAGFPTRGTRAIFVSYRDGLSQIQKFALRFSTSCETETFVNALKEIMGGNRDARLSSSNHLSGISSQSEFVAYDESPYRPKQDWNSLDTNADQIKSGWEEFAQSTNSQDTELNRDIECISGTSALPPSFTSLLMSCNPDTDQSCGKFLPEIPLQSEYVPSHESPYRPKLDWISEDTFMDQTQSSLDYEVSQNSCSHDTTLKRDTDSIFGSLPPGFKSLVMSCLPVVEQDGAGEPASGDIDLRNQIARCLEDSSFQEMLVKVEKVISEIGDDLLP